MLRGYLWSLLSFLYCTFIFVMGYIIYDNLQWQLSYNMIPTNVITSDQWQYILRARWYSITRGSPHWIAPWPQVSKLFGRNEASIFKIITLWSKLRNTFMTNTHMLWQSILSCGNIYLPWNVVYDFMMKLDCYSLITHIIFIAITIWSIPEIINSICLRLINIVIPYSETHGMW